MCLIPLLGCVYVYAREQTGCMHRGDGRINVSGVCLAEAREDSNVSSASCSACTSWSPCTASGWAAGGESVRLTSGAMQRDVSETTSLLLNLRCAGPRVLTAQL